MPVSAPASPGTHPATSRIGRRPPDGRVRYAVVGLGHIAQSAVLPGIAQATRNSCIAALVSSDPTKLEELGRLYNVPHVCGYGEYQALLASGDIDAVYLALPNDQHAAYAILAAEAGVHVLCEKPMAVTSADCLAMIAAASRHGVRLMVAYRLHFERGNLAALTAATLGKLGELRYFTSTLSMQLSPDDIRSRPLVLGGGTLYDLGIYCINAARYLFKAEPIEVAAMSARRADDPRFREIDEMTSATLRFPGDRLATFTCSFGSAATSAYELVGTTASLRVEQAYEHEEVMTQTVTAEGTMKSWKIAKRDQFAAEVDYFSQCVLTGSDPEPSGMEGLADVRIIEALGEAIRRNRSVPLAEFIKLERPAPSQEVMYPPAEKPQLVHARSPSAGVASAAAGGSSGAG